MGSMKRLLMIWSSNPPTGTIAGGTKAQREELAKAFEEAYGLRPVEGPVIIEEIPI